MIVDCHTHIWQSPDQLGQMVMGDSAPSPRPRLARPSAERVQPRFIPAADADCHWAQSANVDRCFVLGFKSRLLGADVPNRYVADYVARYPQKLIGFAGIDPTDPSAVREVRIAHDELRLRGITLSPANQGFHPSDTRAMRVFALAEELGMPVLIQPCSALTEQAQLDMGRPELLDEVARSFPKLNIVISQLGLPWIDATLCLLAKHYNVFADISGLLRRPWQTYTALVAAHQQGVVDKLLFGSDFPYASANDCIESLYSLNQIAHGTNLPIVPREALRGIVERDTVGLLSLA